MSSKDLPLDYLNKIINTVADPIFVKDRKHCWVFLNDAYCKFMGYKRSDLIGKSDYDFFPKDEADVFWEKDEVVFEKGEENINQEYFTDAKGERHILSTKKTLFSDDAGNQYIVGIIRDITEKIHAEEERDKFFDLSLDLLCLAGYDGYFKRVNLAFSRVLGYPIKELTSKPFFEFVHPDDLEKTQKELERHQKGNEIRDFVNRFVCSGGDIKYLSWSCPAPEKGQKEIYAVAHDITRRIKHEEELFHTNIFLDSIIENIPNMIFMKEADQLTFTHFNKAGEELLGYKREDLVGKNDYDFFPKEEADFFTKKDREVLKSDQVLDIPEEKIETRFKGQRILHTRKIRLCNASGKPEYLLGISEDITDQKRALEQEKLLMEAESAAKQAMFQARESELAYEKLKSLQPKLVHSEKLSGIGQLAAGVAHELNSPLTGITTLLRAIKSDKKVSQDVYKKLDIMLNAANHMAKIVANLTSFAKTSQGVESGINFNHIIESSLSFSSYQLLKNNIKIVKKFSDNLLPIKGDPSHLQQVVLNMITNARDVMLKGGTLTITTENDKSHKNVIIKFADTGKGIKKDNIEKIFEPFFTTKKGNKGVGLGLAISRDIIQQSNGAIVVDVGVEKGTTFVITIPTQK